MLVTMGFSFSDVLSTGGKIVAGAALAPILAPVVISGVLVKQGAPLVGSVLHGATSSVQSGLAAIRPQPAASPGAAFGVGGTSALATTATAGSNLPLILGGVAAAGLLLVALLRRRRP
jgi:hypothetical protein